MLISFNLMAESFMEQKNRDWTSLVVTEGNDTRFRGYTTFAENGDVIVFVMDRLAANCELQYLGMNVVGDSPAESSTTSDTQFGQLRIDEYPSHDITYKVSLFQGVSTIFLNVMDFSGDTRLISEFDRGKVVRFKLKTEKKELYLRFSLNGYKESVARTLNMCNKYNQNSDKSYFDNSSPNNNSKNKNKMKKTLKDDASYF